LSGSAFFGLQLTSAKGIISPEWAFLLGISFASPLDFLSDDASDEKIRDERTSEPKSYR
jgi:hypothetical protein